MLFRSIAIPLGATISLQIGQLTRQLGAESFTGAAIIVGIIREAAPIAAALLIAGAGGSAMTADIGARNILGELAAMEVMAINPVGRLVTQRLLENGRELCRERGCQYVLCPVVAVS